MVQSCDTIHIFISKEEGLGGGTRFELTYALRIKKPVTVHWEGFVTGTAHMGGDFGGEPLPDAWKEFFYNTVTAKG